MWLFTPQGFFSAVVRQSNPTEVKVRARAREHLENLMDKYDIDGEVIETPHRDYGFRIFMPRSRWAEIAASEAADISYPNFKGEVGRHDHPEGFIKALHGVWSVMYGFQENLRNED